MLKYNPILELFGALAQLGARMNGIHEATGSSPVCSIKTAALSEMDMRLFYWFCDVLNVCLIIKDTIAKHIVFCITSK